MSKRPTEIVVISGKGGTGKTSVAACFAALAPHAVIADCDVDAADLHLVLAPETTRREEFRSGHVAVVREADCTACGTCLDLCWFEALRVSAKTGRIAVDPVSCEGCGVCVRFCPPQAIDFPEQVAGEWYVSETRFGAMVHARLGIAAENSGKLVSLVRREARRIAEGRGCDWLIVDGPPGIGCPVIASVTGSTAVLIVTEPTLSGLHDMERVLSLTRHFGLPAFVCVNKWDLNPALADEIEGLAVSNGAAAAGRIRYDRAVTKAQVAGGTVVEHGGEAAADIRSLWEFVQESVSERQNGTDGTDGNLVIP